MWGTDVRNLPHIPHVSGITSTPVQSHNRTSTDHRFSLLIFRIYDHKPFYWQFDVFLKHHIYTLKQHSQLFFSICFSTDSTLYYNSTRTFGSHTTWACRAEESGVCQVEAWGVVQVMSSRHKAFVIFLQPVTGINECSLILKNFTHEVSELSVWIFLLLVTVRNKTNTFIPLCI